MEGTKHEKAMLVVLSYIVGLTSGFIGFGLVNNEPFLQNTEPVSTYEPVSIPEPTTEVMMPVSELPATTPTATVAGLTVSYLDGRLVVDNNGSVQLLSVERSKLNLEAASYFTKQGTHLLPPIFTLSSNGKFVFFCEQDSTVDTCKSFVYDLDNNMIHYVTVADTKLKLTRAEAQAVLWQENTLVSGANSSDSVITPWLLTTK